MANTKLTPEQKTERKSLVRTAKIGGVQILNLDNETVMAYQYKGNTVEFALSVMSPDEVKFRAKVGEFYALQRFYCGETIKIGKADFEVMCEVVWDVYLP